MEFQTVALIGMGAVGSVYGKQLFKAYGDCFFTVADASRAKKISEAGISVNGEIFRPRVLSPEDGGQAADFMLVCVKNYQLEDSFAALRPFVGSHTVLLPILNGVTAAERLKAAFPESHVLSGISLGIDAQRLSSGVSYTNGGIIQFGRAGAASYAPEIRAAEECFRRSGIRAEFYADIDRIVWRKWMLNVGGNQVSALTRAPYGKFSAPHIQPMIRAAMEEVVAIAAARGINVSVADIGEIEKVLSTLAPEGKTSMLQDVEAGRKTEVDYFAGTVVAYGKESSVPTPVNAALHGLILGLEAAYGAR